MMAKVNCFNLRIPCGLQVGSHWPLFFDNKIKKQLIFDSKTTVYPENISW